MPEVVVATPENIFQIQHLAHQIWPSAFGDILTTAQINYMLDWMYSPEALKKQMEEKHQFLLITNDENYCGYCSFEHKKELTKLHKIYLLPEVQGKGFGKALLQAVIRKAKEAGSRVIQLNVNRYNRAVAFYKKAGFRIIREEDNPIGNGYFMNDYVMEKLIEG